MQINYGKKSFMAKALSENGGGKVNNGSRILPFSKAPRHSA
jgi:hypothetical protein